VIINSDIQKIYDDVAKEAFQKYSILRENDDGEMKRFRLAEIEIYMIDKKNAIDDIFIHKNVMQLENKKEYEHYSGFDICLGNCKDVYCGVLVRGIMNEKDKIYGPGRVKYKREKRVKISRKIEINYEDIDDEKLFFSDEVITQDIKLKNTIFKLPRVNLGNTTSYKFLDNPEILKTYLNLKARYLRIENKQFYKSKCSPAEPREIFNVLIKSIT
tara:strand:+ start:2731 stop:3375 length:645 start_codon:yes stop_codon:yes gene_type:complete